MKIYFCPLKLTGTKRIILYLLKYRCSRCFYSSLTLLMCFTLINLNWRIKLNSVSALEKIIPITCQLCSATVRQRYDWSTSCSWILTALSSMNGKAFTDDMPLYFDPFWAFPVPDFLLKSRSQGMSMTFFFFFIPKMFSLSNCIGKVLINSLGKEKSEESWDHRQYSKNKKRNKPRSCWVNMCTLRKK